MKRKFLFALNLASLMCLWGCTFLTSCVGDSTSETEEEKYSVTCASEGVTLVGLSSDGYKTEDTAPFTISVSDTTKEVDVVKMGSTVLGNVDGVYSFTMGGSDVVIEVSLKDKVVETYTLSYESSGEFALTCLAQKYFAGDTYLYDMSDTNLVDD